MEICSNARAWTVPCEKWSWLRSQPMTMFISMATGENSIPSEAGRTVYGSRRQEPGVHAAGHRADPAGMVQSGLVTRWTCAYQARCSGTARTRLVAACPCIGIYETALKEFEKPAPPDSAASRSLSHRRILGIVNHQRLANQIAGADKPPIPAVQRQVAIVAQNEVLSLGHHHLAIQDVLPEHLPRGC